MCRAYDGGLAVIDGRPTEYSYDSYSPDSYGSSDELVVDDEAWFELDDHEIDIHFEIEIHFNDDADDNADGGAHYYSAAEEEDTPADHAIEIKFDGGVRGVNFLTFFSMLSVFVLATPTLFAKPWRRLSGRAAACSALARR